MSSPKEVPGELPEPDCYAVLTPNGSKLVSPDEARGLKRSYPLYTAEAIRAAIKADRELRAAGAEPVAFDAIKAAEGFRSYFARNYPGPNTIIHDPNWHAPKLFRAAWRAIEESMLASPAVADKVLPSEALAALILAEDVLSHRPYSAEFWPDGTHPHEGITKIRNAIAALRSGEPAPELSTASIQEQWSSGDLREVMADVDAHALGCVRKAAGEPLNTDRSRNIVQRSIEEYAGAALIRSGEQASDPKYKPCYVCERPMDGLSEDDCHCFHRKELLGADWSSEQAPTARFDHVECQQCGAYYVCERCGNSEPEIVYTTTATPTPDAATGSHE